MAKIAVLGAGSWGTALALQLARNGHQVCLWGHRPEHIQQLSASRENERYLSGFKFPDNLFVVADLASALNCVNYLLLAVPSHVFPNLLQQISAFNINDLPIIWAIKGFSNGRLLSASFAEYFPERDYAILAGPSFAREVASNRPTAVTIASNNEALAAEFAQIFHGHRFICYTSNDVIGIQIGGAVKNVIAIATGITDGLNYGANARAALITRGLSEIARLNEALGGQKETLMGLAGMGDLILTCTDDLSRNRRFGLSLAKGLNPDEAKNSISQVVEGELATHETWKLASNLKIRMPITEHLHFMLSGKRSLEETVQSLLQRTIKNEML